MLKKPGLYFDEMVLFVWDDQVMVKGADYDSFSPNCDGT